MVLHDPPSAQAAERTREVPQRAQERRHGTVAEIQERSVLIKVDGEVKLRVDKNSIVRDYTTDAQASNDQAQQK